MRWVSWWAVLLLKAAGIFAEDASTVVYAAGTSSLLDPTEMTEATVVRNAQETVQEQGGEEKQAAPKTEMRKTKKTKKKKKTTKKSKYDRT
jgi:hypothetical protein